MSVDPYASIHTVAQRMHELKTRQDIETALDEIEYLFEVIPPELQHTAEQLIAMLRDKLANAPRPDGRVSLARK